MNSDRLFVYGTLMRGFDHPMAQLLSRSADFIGEARCRGRLYLIKHYPGLLLSDDPADLVFGELYRLRQPRSVAARVRHVRGLRRGLCRADRIYQADAAGDAGGRQRERGLDLHLQLAGRPACRGSPRDDFWTNAARYGRSFLHHPHIDLALDKIPFFGRAQHGDQFLEQLACSGAYSNQVRKSKGSPRSRQ